MKSDRHYYIVAQAIDFIAQHVHAQPNLAEVAQHVRLSEFYLQRVFQEWCGLSPKKFLQYLTKQHALEVLKTSQSLLATSVDLGLSSASRLHDLMVQWIALTPAEVKARGSGVELYYGSSATPLGQALIVWSKRGICELSFLADPIPPETNVQATGALSADAEVFAAALKHIKSTWSEARFIEDKQQASQWLELIFSQHGKRTVAIVLRGSRFQIQVWEALMKIPSATWVSYQTLAAYINHQQASRAVGSAVASNAIAYLIPCHRVIRSSGAIGQYRWGSVRKQALQLWELPQER